MTINKSVLDELKAVASVVRVNEPMSRHTTLRIGGPAKFYVEVNKEESLGNVMSLAKRYRLNVLPIGRGSNLLVSDKGFNGIALKLCGDLVGIEVADTVVKTGGGTFTPKLADVCAEKSLSGLEFLAGIPGTVGGAIYMNAGLRDTSIGDYLQSVVITADGKTFSLTNREMKFAYRTSILQKHKNWIVSSATFKLRREDKAKIYALMDELRSYRGRTQPLGTYNAGSIFKNPKQAFAGQLIDAAGLKGLKIGGAKVSEKHCNFLVNTGKAKASDMAKLINKVQRTVYGKFGITLEPEIKII